jgi:hypothetical protein
MYSHIFQTGLSLFCWSSMFNDNSISHLLTDIDFNFLGVAPVPTLNRFGVQMHLLSLKPCCKSDCTLFMFTCNIIVSIIITLVERRHATVLHAQIPCGPGGRRYLSIQFPLKRKCNLLHL